MVPAAPSTRWHNCGPSSWESFLGRFFSETNRPGFGLFDLQIWNERKPKMAIQLAEKTEKSRHGTHGTSKCRDVGSSPRGELETAGLPSCILQCQLCTRWDTNLCNRQILRWIYTCHKGRHCLPYPALKSLQLPNVYIIYIYILAKKSGHCFKPTQFLCNYNLYLVPDHPRTGPVLVRARAIGMGQDPPLFTFK